VRAISIKQPWAWAILYAGKRVENRSREVPWSSAIGTTVLIHASAEVTTTEYLDASRFIRSVTGGYPPDRAMIERGGIVGKCRIWGTRTLGQVNRLCNDKGTRDWAFGPICILLDEVVELPFVPCKGRQGLWTVPPELWQ
jgi:hypothetical protein